MKRFICIHGHFYQPPRENPWLEAIELQDSAAPYHDWNARITAECYAPNTAARILDSDGRIVQIVNNYAKLSFNFGPTLLSWLEGNAPEVYRRLLEADRHSRKRFSGHGSALAQVYNHMIMPLANRRDKYTQVLWGIRDFEHRFGRKPEGMWLPETAVDLGTLDILAELGIRFTLLAPSQARCVRRLGNNAWCDVSGGRIDPTMAYMQRLPSGRLLHLFFYDGAIARAVAFEGLLATGEEFAKRLLSAFAAKPTHPQLVHIATDGETYGHHHRHGDMALAYAMHYLEASNLACLTNYGEFLEHHPPTHQVEIIENTAWSCAHGVERWRSHCGCNTGGHPQWQQTWRTPLRETLDWLRDTLALAYETRGRQLLRDPWMARNDYIEVILDRSPERVEGFLHQHATHQLDTAETVTVLKLLELQRHAMLMSTSCGWFFDELSGIETVQVLRHAGRAVQLAEDVFGASLESRFLARLERAKSNLQEHRDGRHIYEHCVKPAAVGWESLGAHYAVGAVFQAYPSHARLYCYTADLEDLQRFEAAGTTLVLGWVKLTSDITWETARLSFGVLHFGDQRLNGGVRRYDGQQTYEAIVEELARAFAEEDIPTVIRLLDRHFGESPCSLKTLRGDAQRQIACVILAPSLAETEAVYRQVYERRAPLMRWLRELHIPLPQALQAAAECVLNVDLRRAFEADTLDPERLRSLLDAARTGGMTLDTATLGEAVNRTLKRLAEQLHTSPTELTLLTQLEVAADLVAALPFPADLWQAQNVCYELLQTVYPEFRECAAQGNAHAQAWLGHFKALGGKLSLRVP